ncbi:MAG: hypothetical protein ACOX8B_06270 [Lachnospiraceae bacterium]|jgi:hypothetical protein
MSIHPRRFVKHLKDQIRTSRSNFILYSILRALVILTFVRCLFTKNFEGAGLCLLSLVLFLLPAFFETSMKIEIPPLFEGIIYCFIFAAEILGEVNHSYVLIPGWDTMLHTLNGFLCAAVGFSLVDLFNRHSERIDLSPIYLTLVAFCFSMTVGVFWEFFEYFMDQFFFLDMQKDFIVKNIGSVTLDPEGLGTPIKVSNISKTIIETESGKEYVIDGGYLDIGINDTMKDLFVNFIGDLGFSIIGYLYVANREKNSMVPAVNEDQNAKEKAAGSNPGMDLARDLLIYRTDEDRPLPDKGEPATEGFWKELKKEFIGWKNKQKAKQKKTFAAENHKIVYDKKGNIIEESDISAPGRKTDRQKKKKNNKNASGIAVSAALSGAGREDLAAEMDRNADSAEAAAAENQTGGQSLTGADGGSSGNAAGAEAAAAEKKPVGNSGSAGDGSAGDEAGGNSGKVDS